MVDYLAAGIVLLVSPHSTGGIEAITDGMVGSLVIGVDRAWELLGAPRNSLRANVVNLARGGKSGE